jgi:hypothetical protein
MTLSRLAVLHRCRLARFIDAWRDRTLRERAALAFRLWRKGYVPVEACSTRHIGEEGGGASRHAVLVGFLVGARALARRRGKYCSGGA